MEAPNPPKHLDAVAKRFWRTYAKTLADSGRLSETDLPSFERLCKNWSILQQLDPTTDSKAAILYMSLNKVIAADSAAFGMTPASRKKMKLDNERRDTPDKFGL